MPSLNVASQWSLMRAVNDQGVMDALTVVTVARLALLLAGEIHIVGSDSGIRPFLTPVVVGVVCWMYYQGLRHSSRPFLHDWFLTCVDALATGSILLSGVGATDGVRSLWISYTLVSGVLIGLSVASMWSAVWAASIVSCIAVVVLKDGRSGVGTILISLGVVFSVMLGNNWRDKIWRIGELSAEAVSSRAAQRATLERLAIARDLHDSLAKSVHGIRMLSETLDGVLEDEGHAYAHLSHTLFDSADEASREARIVLDGLRVGGEDNTVGALKEAVLRWADRASIVPVFDIDDDLGSLPSAPDAMWQLHRIVGEVLVNAEKHSGAQHIYFNAKSLGADLLIEIADDGRGLPASVIAGSGRVGHYGFQGMRERAESLGALFEISSRSEDGVGLCVRLIIPRCALGMSRR